MVRKPRSVAKLEPASNGYRAACNSGRASGATIHVNNGAALLAGVTRCSRHHLFRCDQFLLPYIHVAKSETSELREMRETLR